MVICNMKYFSLLIYINYVYSGISILGKRNNICATGQMYRNISRACEMYYQFHIQILWRWSTYSSIMNTLLINVSVVL